jgi:hypothetical protein
MTIYSNHASKHGKGKTRRADYHAWKKTRRLIAKASRRANRDR